jgi:F-type H+-transporting ATPase subunit b
MLDLSLGLFLFVVVVFLALIYLLNDMLYKPLLAFMEKREGSIRNDLAASEENSDEIESAKTLANEKISAAKSEAAKIREDALTKAKESASAKLEDGKAAIDKEYASFLEKLSIDKDALRKNIAANVSSYQDGIVGKIKNV